MRSFKREIGLIFVIVAIHFVFASYRLLPAAESPGGWSIFIPIGELILVLLLLNGGRFDLLRRIAAGLIIGFLVFYLFGEIFYRYFYLEHFDMFSDMQLIPNLFVMLLPGTVFSPGIIRVLAVLFTIGVLGSIAFFLSAGLKRILSRTRLKIKLPAAIVLTAAALGFILLSPVNSPAIQTVEYVAREEIMESDLSEITLEEPEPEPEEPKWVFPGIQDSDIHLVVIESYGGVLFQKPEYTDYIVQKYEELAPLLMDDGWIIRTGFVRSPAFGGRSWLADSTLLSGEQIVDQRMYDELVSREEPAYLLTFLKNAGYTSFYIAPGSTRASEDWKNAHPFDTYILRADFGYEGPNVAFGSMTDQFAVDTFSRMYLVEDRKDFAFYLLISSHTPFERIPVFKDDWDFSLKGKEYESGYIQYFENNWLTGNELAEGYLEGIGYSLETTVRYLTERLSEKEFMLIIGDHQPRKPISGHDPGYPVPFHFIMPADAPIQFPDNWTLSTTLTPPELPDIHSGIPEMADIPYLIARLVK